MANKLPQISNDDDSVKRAHQVLKAMRGVLRSYPNVVGVGVGVKKTNGRYTDTVCITVDVSKKVPVNRLPRNGVIPKSFHGVPTDVIETALPKGNHFPFETMAPNERWPFLEGGIFFSLCIRGRQGQTALGGTVGVSVFDDFTNEDLLLTNWHVLCLGGTCLRDESVCQPWRMAGGAVATVARVLRWVGPPVGDAAVARLSGNRFALKRIRRIGQVDQVATPHLGMWVRKVGAMTDTTGQVARLSYDQEVDVQHDGVGVEYENQLRIEGDDPIGIGGDSGAAWVDRSDRVVALHFASLNDWAVATPIQTVMSALGINLDNGITQQDFIAVQNSTLF